jgi:hypothetical protein
MIVSTIFPNKSTTNITIALVFIVCYVLLYYVLYRKESRNLL